MALYVPPFLRIQKDLSQLANTCSKSTMKANNKTNERHNNALLVDFEQVNIPFGKCLFINKVLNEYRK